MTTPDMHAPRRILKSQEWETFETLGTNEQRGVPPPPIEKPAPPGAAQFDHVPPAEFTSGTMAPVGRVD